MKMDFCISRKAKISRNLKKIKEISFHGNVRFRESFRENMGIPNIFVKMLTKIVILNILSKFFSKILCVFQILPCPVCPVLVCPVLSFPVLSYHVLSYPIQSVLSCPCNLSWRLVQSDLSQLSCASCLVPDVLSKIPVLTWLSCPSCPVPAAPTKQPCPSNLVHCSLYVTVTFWQS
jgi:hypothetical protein